MALRKPLVAVSGEYQQLQAADTLDPASIAAATTSTSGLLTGADKTKLDGIATNATANTGTVTSVGGTGTVSGMTLSGTVTTSGNLTLGGTLTVAPSNFSSQTSNTVLAAPNGAAGVPTFRALVAADIPTLNQNTTGSSGSCTGNAATVTNGVYTTGAQTIAGVKTFSDSTATTSATTGAVVITGGLGVSGSIYSAGNVTAYSDERLKENWRSLGEGFVSRLAGVKMGVYDRIDTGETQVGVSAQSLQKVLPEAVTGEETLGVTYGNAALAACVELARELTTLRAEVESLKSQLGK